PAYLAVCHLVCRGLPNSSLALWRTEPARLPDAEGLGQPLCSALRGTSQHVAVVPEQHDLGVAQLVRDVSQRDSVRQKLGGHGVAGHVRRAARHLGAAEQREEAGPYPRTIARRPLAVVGREQPPSHWNRILTDEVVTHGLKRPARQDDQALGP